MATQPQQPEMSSTERLYAIMSYRDTIRRTPDDVFPCAAVQDAMLARIEAGDTLYVYWSGSAYLVYHDGVEITPRAWAIAHGLMVAENDDQDDSDKEAR